MSPLKVPAAVADPARKLMEQALLSGDGMTAQHAVHMLLRSGVSLPTVYSSMIQPLMDRVGDGWQDGKLRVADEHLCSAAVRDLVARLAAGRTFRPGHRGQVVLVLPPGEKHIIGLLMLQDALIDDGWLVNRPDAIPLAELPAYIEHFDDVRLIGVSAHNLTHQWEFGRQLARLRSELPRIPVVLGGYALRRNPSLWQQVGAHGGAVDVPEGLALVNRLTNPLTPREIQVLSLAGDGHTNNQIGIALGVDLSTVKTHLERVYEKVGTRNRTVSVATALRRGWML